jgi:hypothetical protein
MLAVRLEGRFAREETWVADRRLACCQLGISLRRLVFIVSQAKNRDPSVATWLVRTAQYQYELLIPLPSFWYLLKPHATWREEDDTHPRFDFLHFQSANPTSKRPAITPMTIPAMAPPESELPLFAGLPDAV